MQDPERRPTTPQLKGEIRETNMSFLICFVYID